MTAIAIKKLQLKASIHSIELFCQFVAKEIASIPFSKEKLHAIELSLEETLANIIKHSYENQPSELITVTCEIDEQQSLHLHVKHKGDAFNLIERPIAPAHKTLEALEKHGFGCALIKHLTDKLHYVYKEGVNIFTLTFDSQAPELD